MKVTGRQRNSRMCVICGLDNEQGVRAPFYNMEDGSVMSKFQFREHHQSYPGRVHGGMITAMLDEMGLRALWAHTGNEEEFGVTMSLTTDYRRPVPYETDLLARGVIVKNTSKFFVVEAQLFDMEKNLLANGTIKYIKLDVSKIAEGASAHEEMCYALPADCTEIDWN